MIELPHHLPDGRLGLATYLGESRHDLALGKALYKGRVLPQLGDQVVGAQLDLIREMIVQQTADEIGAQPPAKRILE